MVKKILAPGKTCITTTETFVVEEVNPQQIEYYSSPNCHPSFRYFWLGETSFNGEVASQQSWWNKQSWTGGSKPPTYSEKAPKSLVEIAKNWFETKTA